MWNFPEKKNELHTLLSFKVSAIFKKKCVVKECYLLKITEIMDHDSFLVLRNVAIEPFYCT